MSPKTGQVLRNGIHITRTLHEITFPLWNRDTITRFMYTSQRFNIQRKIELLCIAIPFIRS